MGWELRHGRNLFGLLSAPEHTVGGSAGENERWEWGLLSVQRSMMIKSSCADVEGLCSVVLMIR